MKESTKALLLSAAVLVAILLITVAVKVFGKADTSPVESELENSIQEGTSLVKDQIFKAGY